MESQQQSSGLVKHALRFGAIMGGIGIALTLLIYVVDYTFLADWKIGLVMIALTLGVVIYAGINYRNETGGFISYGKAFQHGFITMAVAGLLSILFTIILYTVVDTELPQKLVEASIEKTEAMMESFGAPADKIDEQLDKMREDLPQNYSVVGQLKFYLYALIGYAVISAITSLFVRKRQPEII
jgi:hypothetical protein